ncbi:MAG: hypothetical protein JXA33_04640 [Anaerolineae bacterium]|nr:hypothetical protein [Anaerolineae bacterium]
MYTISGIVPLTGTQARVTLTILALFICLFMAACAPDTTPILPSTLSPSPVSYTATVTPSPPANTRAPTSTPLVPATPSNATPTPVLVTPSSSGLTIQSFTVDVEDFAGGKRFTCNWETTGASSVRILIGTAQRFQPWWDVDLSGTLLFEQERTLMPDPDVTLIAWDGEGNEVMQSVEIDWPCPYQYFFLPGPADCPGTGMCYCPLKEETVSFMAEQSFEHGRMFWLEQVPDLDRSVILVLYEDGNGERYDDTWTSEMPELDPALTPPAGLYQPVRGFGKLWRETPDVRERLGWALSPELGFDGVFQQQTTENIPDVVYIESFDGQIIRLSGVLYMTRGSWDFVAP